MYLTVILLVHFVAALSRGPEFRPINFGETKIDELIAFGDSYTFVQGTQGHWAYSFISDAFNYSFTPEQLLKNEIVKNVTSSGGPNWVEYLTGCYQGLPADCSGTKLWDFAFAGADITAKYLPLHHNYTVDLDDQVLQWDKYARETLKSSPDNTLIAFWIGINDINDSSKFTNVSFPEYYNMLVDAYFESVELIYARGFHKFLFMLLPPLEKTSSNLVSKDPRPNYTQVTEFNKAISNHVSAFQSKYADDGVQTYTFDTYTYLNTILASPQQYGITNTTSFCSAYNAPDILWNYANYGCQPISEYFWLNSGHITYTVHKWVALELKRQIGTL